MTAGNGQAPTAPTVSFTDERLGNGLRLIMSRDPLAPVAAVNIWYNVGSRHEVPSKRTSASPRATMDSRSR